MYRSPTEQRKMKKDSHQDTFRDKIQENGRGDTSGPHTHALRTHQQSDQVQGREDQYGGQTQKYHKKNQEYQTPSKEACQELAQCSGPRTRTSRKVPKTYKSDYCSMWWKTTRKGQIQSPLSGNQRTLTYKVGDLRHLQKLAIGIPQKQTRRYMKQNGKKLGQVRYPGRSYEKYVLRTLGTVH